MRSRSLKRGVTAVLVGVLAGVGCSGRGDDATRAAPATVRTEPATTTTSVFPVDQVPAVIDVAYVQRVIDALDHVMGDAVRALVAARVPDRAFYERLRAVYLDPEFERVQADFGRDAAEGLNDYRASPADPSTHVDRLITGNDECIWVADTRDFGPFLNFVPADDAKRGFLAFGRKRSELDLATRNPTAWMIAYDGRRLNGEEPRNPCA